MDKQTHGHNNDDHVSTAWLQHHVPVAPHLYQKAPLAHIFYKIVQKISVLI